MIAVLRLTAFFFLFAGGTSAAVPARSDAVSWTIGDSSSVVDGGSSTGTVTFTWRFDRPVEHGVYADGTPWVVWEEGLKLIGVSPEKTQADLLNLGSIVPNGIMDATCINPGAGLLPLDERMGAETGLAAGDAARPWGDGSGVWNGAPAALMPGDCIVTGKSRRDDRGVYRRMLFNAIGVCNVVSSNQTGRYRPPIRMPAELRAALTTPAEVKVASLPLFNLPQTLDWQNRPVAMNLSGAVSMHNSLVPIDADRLLNGPIGNCGIYTHIWYETANGLLNHDLSGTMDSAYQRDVAQRIATCLYTAFDPNADSAKRQRSLNKFIQIGLDYFYMHSLGYPVGNGGGGHPDGIEGAITLAGALLGDASITDAMKYQRFKGEAVGQPGRVYDMLSGSMGDFSRSEALHTVSAADWKSGAFLRRAVGSGASTLQECMIRTDLAHPGMVLNSTNVPYTSIQSVDSNITAIWVSTNYQWRVYSENIATEANRSRLFIPGGVLRLDGDRTIRKIFAFKPDLESDWTDLTWGIKGVQGRGGVLLVHPALTASEIQNLGSSGTLTTGVCTEQEAVNDEIVLWDAWPVLSHQKAGTSYFASPVHDYLDNKVGDFFHWLPYYGLLDDPGAPGKKLCEESMTFYQLKRFVQMQRNSGQYLWDVYTAKERYNLPDSPTIQALVRHYLLDGTLPSVFCRTYSSSDRMWNDPQ